MLLSHGVLESTTLPSAEVVVPSIRGLAGECGETRWSYHGEVEWPLLVSPLQAASKGLRTHYVFSPGLYGEICRFQMFPGAEALIWTEMLGGVGGGGSLSLVGFPASASAAG